MDSKGRLVFVIILLFSTTILMTSFGESADYGGYTGDGWFLDGTFCDLCQLKWNPSSWFCEFDTCYAYCGNPPCPKGSIVKDNKCWCDAYVRYDTSCSEGSCGAGYICNLFTGICEIKDENTRNYPCESYVDCPNDMWCDLDEGFCTCQTDSDCPEDWEVCDFSYETWVGECVDCFNNEGCEEGFFCDIERKWCIECNSNEQCLDKYCSLLDDDCLEQSSCGEGYVCRDNQDSIVTLDSFCRQFTDSYKDCTDVFGDYCYYNSKDEECLPKGGQYSIKELWSIRKFYSYVIANLYNSWCIPQASCDKIKCNLIDNTCVECTNPSHCAEENCNILENNCLDASCDEGYVCQDNQNFVVNVEYLCHSFDLDCAFYEPYCTFLDSKGCVANISDKTIYEIYTNYRKLWIPVKNTVYDPKCIREDDCPDYWNCVSGICKSDECKWECNYDTQYCDGGVCINKVGYFEDCSSDQQCLSGYCSPFGYCTEECTPPGNCPEISVGCFPLEYEYDKSDYFLCVECLNNEDCYNGVPCIHGRCKTNEDTGEDKVVLSGQPEYLGGGIIKVIYGILSSDSVKGVSPVEGRGLSIQGIVINKDFLKLNLSSNIGGNSVGDIITQEIGGESFSNYGVSSTYTTSSKLEEKGETFQNFFFNLSDALKFIYDDGTHQYVNTSLVYTCDKEDEGYILSYDSKDYFCLKGKGYFCESGRPCAYILKPSMDIPYKPNEEISYEALVSLDDGLPIHYSYWWYIFDDFLFNGPSVRDPLPPYPYIYDLKLKVNNSDGEEDTQNIDLNVVSDIPGCIRRDNQAIWSYFNDSGEWIKEIVGDPIRPGSYTTEKDGGIVSCNYSKYGGSANCCPEGQVCVDNICVNSTRGYCSMYTDEYNCTTDPKGYAGYNTALPGGATCSKPFYNSTEQSWYTTNCFCTWEDNQCKSSYNLFKNGDNIGTCSVSDVLIAGNCSAGDEFQVFKRTAEWTPPSAPRPAGCVAKENMIDLCEGDFYKLNFFTWLNFVLVIIGVFLIYYILYKMKKEKKKLKSSIEFNEGKPQKSDKVLKDKKSSQKSSGRKSEKS